jgi:hypothetical protein
MPAATTAVKRRTDDGAPAAAAGSLSAEELRKMHDCRDQPTVRVWNYVNGVIGSRRRPGGQFEGARSALP